MDEVEREYLEWVDARFMELALRYYATPQEVCDLYGVEIEDFWAFQRLKWREAASEAKREAAKKRQKRPE